MRLLKVFNKNIRSIKFHKNSFFFLENVPYKYSVQTFEEIRLYDRTFIFHIDIDNLDTKNIYPEDQIIGISSKQICFTTEGVNRNENISIYENNRLTFFKDSNNNSEENFDLIKNFYRCYPHNTDKVSESESTEIYYNPINAYVVRWNLPSDYSLFTPFEESYSLIRNKFICLYSSLSGKKLWEYDLRKYFKRTIPTYANNEPMYTIEVEKVVYNPAFNSLLLSITPNIKVSLDANTGNLLWEAENYPTSGPYYVMDQETGHTHYFTLEIGRGQATDQVFYHVMNGATGELLHSRDFTEDLQIPTTKIDQICMKPQMGAFKDNYLYFTLGDLGRLYQMNKHTYKVVKFDEQEDVYYESMPVVYKNRLFLIEDNDIKKLWVFEV